MLAAAEATRPAVRPECPRRPGGYSAKSERATEPLPLVSSLPSIQQWTPLHLAAKQGQDAVVRTLILAGAAPHVRTMDMETPRDIAARMGNVEACKLLGWHEFARTMLSLLSFFPTPYFILFYFLILFYFHSFIHSFILYFYFYYFFFALA